MKNLILLIFVLFSFSAISQEMDTDRPDQTESSSTLTKGSLQIESGLLYRYTTTERQVFAPTTLFRYGLTDRIEIRVTNQFENLRSFDSDYLSFGYYDEKYDIKGLGDLEFGAKFQLLKKEDVNTEIAFLTHISLPTGTSSITKDVFGSINKLAISHKLTPNINLGYNIGYNLFGEGNGDLTYSVVFGIEINSKARIFIESYGEYTDFELHIANFDAGITYLLLENLQLDFSFGSGINHNMNFIATGFSWNIGKE